MTHGKTRIALALVAALLACAGIEPPPGPSPFREVKKLVLVRRVDDLRSPRGRDPLDASKESLEARGYAVRVVELGARDGAELRDLARLEDRVATHFWTRERWRGRAESLGSDAGAAVAKLGVDAVLGYHRLADQLPPAMPPAAQAWGMGPPPLPATQPHRPTGALSLVAADGSAAWFPWGGPGADLDPGALINPAEAIDAVMAALAGDTGDG